MQYLDHLNPKSRTSEPVSDLANCRDAPFSDARLPAGLRPAFLRLDDELWEDLYYRDIAINLASNQSGFTALCRQMLYSSACRLIGLNVITLANHLVASSHAGLRAALLTMDEVEKGPPAIASRGKDFEFLESAGYKKGEIINLSDPESASADFSFVCFCISESSDFPAPTELKRFTEKRIWVHYDIHGIDPQELFAGSDRTAIYEAVNAPCVRSITLDLQPVSGMLDLAVVLYPNDPSAVLLQKGRYTFLMPTKETRAKKEAYFSESHDTLDTSISAIPVCPTLYEISLRLGCAPAFASLFDFGFDNALRPIEIAGSTDSIVARRHAELYSEPLFAVSEFNNPLDLANMRSTLEPPSPRGLQRFLGTDINSNDAEMKALRKWALDFAGEKGLKLGDSQFTGVLLESGSAANFAAFQSYQRYQENKGRPQGSIVNSSLTHKSFAKISSEQCRIVSIEPETFQMSERALLRALKRNDMLVINLGTTSLGHTEFVPNSVIEYCRQNQIWIHLDCCYGLNILFREDESPIVAETKEYLQNLLDSGAVRSVSTDLHKLCAPFGAAILFLSCDGQEDSIASRISRPKSAFAFEAARRRIEQDGLKALSKSLENDHIVAQSLAKTLLRLTDLKLVRRVESSVVALRCADASEMDFFHEALLESGISVARLHIRLPREDIFGIKLVATQVGFSNNPWSDASINEICSALSECLQTARSRNRPLNRIGRRIIKGFSQPYTAELDFALISTRIFERAGTSRAFF